MTCSKNMLYNFTRNLYRLFKEQPELFVLKKLHTEKRVHCRKTRDCVHGWCIKDESEDDSILLDYRYDLLSTLVHESNHYLYDEWREEQVWEIERAIMSRLSLKQVKNIIRRFAAIL